jgi:hypothetical protein
MEHMMKMGKKKRLEVIVLLWTWWTERNRIREGDRKRQPNSIALGLLIDAMEIQKVFEVEGSTKEKRKQRWKETRGRYIEDQLWCILGENPKSGGWEFVI